MVGAIRKSQKYPRDNAKANSMKATASSSSTLTAKQAMHDKNAIPESKIRAQKGKFSKPSTSSPPIMQNHRASEGDLSYNILRHHNWEIIYRRDGRSTQSREYRCFVGVRSSSGSETVFPASNITAIIRGSKSTQTDQTCVVLELFLQVRDMNLGLTAAVCVLKSQTYEDYYWIFAQFKHVIQRTFGTLPDNFITDNDSLIMRLIAQTFPKSVNYVSSWNMERRMTDFLNSRSCTDGLQSVEMFACLARAQSELEFNFYLTGIRITLGTKHMLPEYFEKVWLPARTALCNAWRRHDIDLGEIGDAWDARLVSIMRECTEDGAVNPHSFLDAIESEISLIQLHATKSPSPSAVPLSLSLGWNEIESDSTDEENWDQCSHKSGFDSCIDEDSTDEECWGENRVTRDREIMKALRTYVAPNLALDSSNSRLKSMTTDNNLSQQFKSRVFTNSRNRLIDHQSICSQVPRNCEYLEASMLENQEQNQTIGDSTARHVGSQPVIIDGKLYIAPVFKSRQ